MLARRQNVRQVPAAPPAAESSRRERATSHNHARCLALAEWVALALALVALTHQLSAPDPRIGDDDFQVFYAGAVAIAAGQSPYVGDYVSPPWFALLLLPLTALPLPVARGVWLALSLALLLGTTWLSSRIVGLSWPLRRLLLAAALFALWPPVEFGIRLGQNTLLAWALLLGATLAVSARMYGPAGGLLALSLIKPQLGFLLAGGLAVAAIPGTGLPRMASVGAGVLAPLALSVWLVAPTSYTELLATPPRTWDYWGSTVALPPLLAWLVGSQPIAIAVYLPIAAAGAALVLREWALHRPPGRSGALPPTEIVDDLADAQGGAARDGEGSSDERRLAYLAALTAGATLVLTPYAYPYDAILLQLPVLWLIARAGAASASRRPQLVLTCATGLLCLWLLERPAEYSASRFLGLLPPLGLTVAILSVRRSQP
jgi:hypothetical protein